MLRRLRSLLRVLKSRAEFENSMAEELHSHVEHYAQDLIRSGLSREEAYRRARLDMGGLNSVKDDCREARATVPGRVHHRES